jgi:phosphate-selective porin
MDNKVVSTIISAAALSGVAVAGPAPVIEEKSCGSWCDTLETIGTVYSDKENPWVQKVKFFGRAQVQYAYIDGQDVNGDDFNADFDEVRRLRFGGEVKFLNGFKLKANANFVRDLTPVGGDRDFEYTVFDQAKISYTFKDLLGADDTVLTYGRYKVALGAEQHTSSKKIKTVERSGIANKLTVARPTGASVDYKSSNWSTTLGVFSNDYRPIEDELISGWGESVAVYSSTEFSALGGDFIFDAIYNDRQNVVDPFLYEWATSLAYSHSLGEWGLTYNAILGDNGSEAGENRDGLFYGFVALATTDIVEDKLEFVSRYAFQGAEESQGIRTSSRYFRRNNGGDVDGGRGDAHHAVYAGLNWYLCGDRSKFMTGVEYDNLNTAVGQNPDAFTYWLAYRMYF